MSGNVRERALQAARAQIEEIDPGTAWAHCADAGWALVDVREEAETRAGMPQGALALPRSMLELRISESGLTADRPIALICAGGARSLLCAATLAGLGFSRVYSVSGGFDAWKAAGLPVTRPPGDADWLDRYSRHLRLPEIGIEGQQRLAAAKVLVVGAGGLGSPVLLYLAAAGVGHLSIIDDDRVERSNLQRQVVHADNRIGMPKAESARASLLALNPRLQIAARVERLDEANADALVAAHDLVVDGSDNLATRYRLSDACVRQARPLVFAAVHRFEGQVSVFDAGRRPGESPCYRCLFPEPPGADGAPNCSEVGVLGITPGVVGLLQANEAVKVLLGIGRSLDGYLLHVDLLNMRFRETRLRADPACPGCGIGPRNGGVDETHCATAIRG